MQDWLNRNFPQLTDVQPLAQGGQKAVFAARHPTDGDVVLKIILPGQDHARVHREILAVQQINSSRVPRVLEVGAADLPDGARVWLREQRVAGVALRTRLASGPLSSVEVRRLALDVLEALSDAERARIVHRDVKPENVIAAPDGRYWLLDFGIARHLDLQSLTATAAMGGPGTLGYAPPEQYRNRKREVDSRADLFALAVTIVECLTGRHPFRHGARDAPEVIRRIEGTTLDVPRLADDPHERFRELIISMGQRRVDPRPRGASDALAWMRDICAEIGM